MGSKKKTRGQQRRRTSEDAFSLKMTVAVGPDVLSLPSLALRVDREIALLRTALLYADDVQLLSPTCEIIEIVQQFAGATGRTFLAQLASLDCPRARWLGIVGTEKEWEAIRPHLASPEAIELHTDYFRRHAATPEQARQVDEIMAQHFTMDMLETMAAKMRDQLDEQAEQTHFAELAPFIRNKRIKLVPVGADLAGGPMDASYMMHVSQAASDARRYLLTDEGTAGRIQYLITQGQLTIPSASARNAKEAGLHRGFVEQMPNLPNAPLDLVWELRSDLSDPLGRYRAELAKLGQAIATSAYDKGFIADVEHQWITTVSPALTDLEAALNAASRLKAFLKIAGLGGIIEGTLGTGAHLFLGWSPDPATLLRGGTAAYLISSGIGGAQGAHEERRKAKQAPFYFLHEADRRVGKHHPRP